MLDSGASTTQPVGREHGEGLPNLDATVGKTRETLQLGGTCSMHERHPEFFLLLVHAMSTLREPFCYLHPQKGDVIFRYCALFEIGDQSVQLSDLQALRSIVPKRVARAP